MNLFEMNMKMGDVSDGLSLDEGCGDMADEYKKFKKGEKPEDEENSEENSEEKDD